MHLIGELSDAMAGNEPENENQNGMEKGVRLIVVVALYVIVGGDGGGAGGCRQK